jgi:hypothetical protein
VTSLKLPWEPIDAHGDGILARIVHDAEFGHIGVFDTAEQARSVCDTMNRAAGVEAERRELAAEANRLLEENSALSTKLARVEAVMAEYANRKPLPEMSKLASITLVASYCLDTIEQVQEALR